MFLVKAKLAVRGHERHKYYSNIHPTQWTCTTLMGRFAGGSTYVRVALQVPRVKSRLGRSVRTSGTQTTYNLYTKVKIAFRKHGSRMAQTSKLPRDRRDRKASPQDIDDRHKFPHLQTNLPKRWRASRHIKIAYVETLQSLPPIRNENKHPTRLGLVCFLAVLVDHLSQSLLLSTAQAVHLGAPS